MNVRVVHRSVTEIEADCLVVNLFEGVRSPGGAAGAVDRALGGAISRAIAAGEFEGKAHTVASFPVYGQIPARRVLVVGLGKAERFDTFAIREAAATAAIAARKARATSVASIVHGAGIGGLEPQGACQATVEGSLLGFYSFDRYKAAANGRKVGEFTIVEHDPGRLAALEAGASRGGILGAAVNLARDLVNEPANLMTPSLLAGVAREVAAEEGMECTVLDRGAMEELGMGALLGVARGSAEPPCLIVLNYRGLGKDAPALALVGKGLTFDSGGICLKPADSMAEMKDDMAGGAAVIAAMKAIARLKPALDVVGIVPATENLPSGAALKPGDVVRAMNGTTIEVVNTDAEGRLILADGVAYARRLGASRIVDIATLTGACVVALGKVYTGLVTNDPAFGAVVQQAARDAGERVWPLPGDDIYRELLDSTVADIKNSGGRWAGATLGALFIRTFAGDVPWAHLDIAGTASMTEDKPWQQKGGTGAGVRTLVEVALSLARK